AHACRRRSGPLGGPSRLVAVAMGPGRGARRRGCERRADPRRTRCDGTTPTGAPVRSSAASPGTRARQAIGDGPEDAPRRRAPPRARGARRRPSTCPPVAAAQPAVEAAPTAAPPPAVAAPSPEGAATAATPGASAGSQLEPAVRLRSIGYATAPEKRTATLT